LCNKSYFFVPINVFPLMRNGFPVLLLWIISLPLYSQKKNASFLIHIHHTNGPVRVDGVLDEPTWKEAEVARDFFMILPMDTSLANVKTEVRMAYNDRFFYLSAVCYDGMAGPYMVESLRRDFSFTKNDNFIFFLDTYGDQTNGFTFGTNAAGAQWDGTMYEGGKVDLSWDNIWYSRVKEYPDKWIMEIAIPFKTLRYKKGIPAWGINLSRNDLKTTEKSSWAPVPRQFPSASLAYTGTLLWDSIPPAPGTNVSFIPYVLTRAIKGYDNKLPTQYKTMVGGDAKFSVTSSLNLDLTVNPDFSQIEVDKQVVDLSRYELFYPEKRQFFLENGDQFNNFGYADLRPFFSRRIGLGVPIEFGARLSGKLDKNWRIGAMDMQTGTVDSIGLPQQNFAVLALQRKVFARSNIGFLWVNKQSIDYNPMKDSTYPQYTTYNRTFGLEFNLASNNNFWTGKQLVMKSYTPDLTGKNWVVAGNLQYSSRKWLINGAYQYIGSNYRAEAGYIPRTGFIRFYPQVSYYLFPNGGAVLSQGPQWFSNFYYNEKFQTTDNENIVDWLITFRNKATLTFLAIQDYVKLQTPFDPTNTGIAYLPVGSVHNWYTGGIDFASKPQSIFTYTFSFRYGGYYAQGNKFTFQSDVGFRIQPFVSITMSTSYNLLDLPEPWGQTPFLLAGPRIDITFTNNLYFTTFVQYNEQVKNMNINARFQWRYKPASDFFLVYTDNYYTSPFKVRDRAVVLKLNYWLNM
jgi:Domain of unknown function (DUF5916)/Carbohydrate family 9 binding domain-like